MTRIVTTFVLLAGLALPVAAQTTTSACSAISLGDLGSLNGWVPSPNDAWHQDISGLAVDPSSNKIVTTAGDLGYRFLHPDFSNVVDGAYGIPYTVVDSTKIPFVPITPYDASDSDNTLYPITANTPIEGSPGQCWTDGNYDHHAIIIDRTTCVSYEIYQADLCSGQWSSYGNVIWDFTLPAGEKRPYGVSSVDAAGLSVFEGLIRYDEIVAGQINHAIRFTAVHTKQDNANGYFTAPATHAAGNLWGTDNIMGMRIRLQASFDVSKYSQTNQIILNAMKKYGMILADNGGDLFFQGTPDPRWDDNDLSALKQIPSTAFEVVKMNSVYDAYTAPAGPAPSITSFTASANNVAPGTPVTLTPKVTNGSYEFVDNAGFTRGPLTVSPNCTTTYTLYSRNEFDTSTSSVTVNVTGVPPSGCGATSGSGTTPSLVFTPVGTQTYPTSPFAVSATSNSPGAITFVAVSGPATVSGNIVTLTGTGTVVLEADQAASGTFNAASTQMTFAVNSSVTTVLQFNAIADQILGVAPFTVSTTSNSPGAITYAVLSGPATLQGNLLTVTGAGHVVLVASQAASGFYPTATALTAFNVTATATTPNLVFNTVPNQIFGAAPFSVSATSNSTGAIAYSVVSGPATISGNTVTVTGAGTVTLKALQAASGNYTTATANAIFIVSAIAPTLSFNTVPNQTFGVAPFTVSASSNSTGTITYSVTSGPATISGNTVTLTGSGSVTLKAAQSAAGNYTAGTVYTSFSVSGTAPTLSFNAVANQTFGAAPFAVSATSNSTGAITYSVLSGPATISGNTVTLTGAGSVTLQASQAATAGYTAATASTSFTVTGATPTLSFSPIANQVMGAAPFAVSASSNSTGAVTYTVVNGPATIAGNTVTVTGVGSVTLQASQAAAGGYGAATATTSFNVSGAGPTLVFNQVANQTFGAAPFAVSATSNSTGPISYAVLSGPATLSGNIVTLNGSGTVVLQASQAASGSYVAAAVTSSFTVSNAASNLAFGPIANQTFGATPFAVSATSNSPGAITYSILTGPATLSGNVVSLTGTGTVVLQASQAAATGFSAATASTSFNVSAVTPTLTFQTVATQAFGAAPFAVSAGSNSTGAITYSVLSGPASIAGNIVTLTGSGTVVLQANQAAATGFASASANTSFNITAVTPTVTLGTIPSQTFGAAPFAINATSNSPGAITYSVVSGPASISGSIVTLTGSGNVTIQASQAASGGYSAATAVTSFNVNSAGTGLTIGTIPTQSFGGPPVALSATSNSPGTITWSVLSGPAVILGNTVSFTAAGPVTLQATQSAAGSYLPATVTTSFTISPALPNLSITSIPTQTFGSGPLPLTANSNSNTPITYTVVSGPATVIGSTLTLNGTGSVTIQATQPASANYLAGSATTSFTISPSSVVLAGDFALPNNITITMNQGESKNVTIPVSAVNGFNGIVSLHCAVPAAMTFGACNTTTAQVTSSNATGATITVSTKGPITTAEEHSSPLHPATTGLVFLGCLLPCGLPFLKRRKINLRRLSLGIILALSLGAISMTTTGCGMTIVNAFTPAGTYVLHVDAASGPAAHAMTITVIVQQPAN